MKFVALTATIILLLAFGAAAFEIGLSIDKVYRTELRYFNYNDTFSTHWFETEVVNTGSLPYIVQLRITVQNENGTIFTAWSNKKDLAPGGNGVFNLYWRPEKEGAYEARVRIYYSGEMVDKNFSITVKKASSGNESAFRFENFRTFRNIMTFTLVSSKDIKEAAIIPSGFEQGWVFGQALIKDIKSEVPKKIVLTYTPAAQTVQPLTLQVSSIYDEHSKSQQFLVQRETGFFALLQDMILGYL